MEDRCIEATLHGKSKENISLIFYSKKKKKITATPRRVNNTVSSRSGKDKNKVEQCKKSCFLIKLLTVIF